MVNMHWAYLKYMLRHKWYVYQECRKLGLSRWAGIIHDLSRFTPTEWSAFAGFFYGDWKSGTEYRGESEAPPKLKRAYDYAWNHHMKANKHHWQYWLMMFDEGKVMSLPIPDRYRREMLADWNGAARSIPGGLPTREWYAKNRHLIVLHPETRTWVDDQLNYLPLP